MLVTIRGSSSKWMFRLNSKCVKAWHWFKIQTSSGSDTDCLVGRSPGESHEIQIWEIVAQIHITTCINWNCKCLLHSFLVTPSLKDADVLRKMQKQARAHVPGSGMWALQTFLQGHYVTYSTSYVPGFSYGLRVAQHHFNEILKMRKRSPSSTIRV